MLRPELRRRHVGNFFWVTSNVLTLNDFNLLEGEVGFVPCDLQVDRHKHGDSEGFWIRESLSDHYSTRGDAKDVLHALGKTGYSPEFITLLIYARTLGVDWILVETSGPDFYYDDLWAAILKKQISEVSKHWKLDERI